MLNSASCDYVKKCGPSSFSLARDEFNATNCATHPRSDPALFRYSIVRDSSPENSWSIAAERSLGFRNPIERGAGRGAFGHLPVGFLFL